MKKLFGTDGIRGEAGKFPLDAATVHVIGRSLATRLAERKGAAAKIVVGRDTRESGGWMEAALISGARAAGAEIESGGVITTPGVAFLTRTLPRDAGVVISASHNPFQDNGIKVFAASGRKLDDAMERLIESDIASQTKSSELTARGVEAKPDDSDRSEELRTQYINYLTDEFGRDLSLANLKIVVDCANGAASEIAPAVLRRLGAHVVAINHTPDGRNINLNAGSLHIESLQERVVAEGSDLGVAFDGDADRALFVDAAGRFVDGDATLWVLANYLKACGELSGDKVVATVMSNIGLEIALRSQGINLVRTDVGDKYVLEELLRSGGALGGEQSGHIIFPKVSLAGDGIITTLMLLSAIVEKQESLGDLTQGIQRYPQVLVNVRVREKRPFEELPSVQRLASEIQQTLGDRGRLLLRYSGTEPLARVMIEGPTEAEVNQSAQSLAAAIQKEIGASSDS
ncbi:MAG TPA: phosphoglucosamine mutase [Pyrinomonadaceae bacterium]|nr:phosphoglucosamine mutase [Pyrinomonadaceae bacterium]